MTAILKSRCSDNIPLNLTFAIGIGFGPSVKANTLYSILQGVNTAAGIVTKIKVDWVKQAQGMKDNALLWCHVMKLKEYLGF